jgi:hypothetical protein
VYGSADFKACAKLLLQEPDYLSATMDTNHSICYLSKSVQFSNDAGDTNWYATRYCLVADDEIKFGK